MSPTDDFAAAPAPDGPANAAGTILKGALMGAAEAVPGVSASSIALMSGIYPRLIRALAQFDVGMLQAALRRRWADVGDRVEWRFLALLAAGMLPGLWLSALGLGWALEHGRPALMASFVGLLGVGAALALQAVRRPRLRYALAAGGAAAGLAAVALLTWLQGLGIGVPLVVAGALAIAAMLLPGISGSFVLLSLGSYETVIRAVADLDFWILGQVALGVAAGGLLAVRFIYRAYLAYRGAITTTMGGLMLGVMPVLWPWRHPEHGAWLSLDAYALQGDAMPLACVLAVLAGAAAGWGVAALARPRPARKGP